MTITGGMFAGHQAQVRHELAGPFESTPVADLGEERHGADGVDATEAAEAIDLGLVGGAEGEGVDLLVQILASADQRAPRF
jgi:hypothetical protein